MSRKEHVPIRSCLGCGERGGQIDMLRITRNDGGRLVIDATRRAGGRGGYLHHSVDCWTRFVQRKGMVRSFRAAVERSARAALFAEWQVGICQ